MARTQGLSYGDMDKQFQRYKKRVKGLTRMSRQHFSEFHYGKPAEGLAEFGEPEEKTLRKAGIDWKTIRRLQGKK